jgi:RND family efflux transporter MFP subunit
LTRVIRILINIVIVVVIVSAIAGYKADLVASIFPVAGPYAKSVHDMLPSAIVGAPPATAAAAPPPRPAVNVVVGHASKKDLPWTIQALGTAQPITSVALRPRYDAMVNEVKIADGSEVKAGDVLIELDSAQLRAMLGVAQAQLAKDQATLEQNKRDVVRFTDLVSRNAEPGVNLDNAKTAVESTNAAIEGDKAQIQNLQVQIGWAEIVAPISGRVGVVNIKAGNIAKTGDNSPTGILATINQISPIYVSFSLAQNLLPSIRQAMSANAKVTARPQGSTKIAEGSLTLIDNSVDPTTGTIVARATFPNADELLWPGQLCDLTISLATEPNVVVTPREAVQTGQNGTYVFTIVNGAAHVQPVEIGRQQGQEIVILKGLNGDETVVVDGALLLTEGAAVNVREAAKGGA